VTQIRQFNLARYTYIYRVSDEQISGGFWPGMKAGIYARVSTHDQHTLDMQIAAIKKYVQAREWQIEIEIGLYVVRGTLVGILAQQPLRCAPT
jgi:predicted site-specific integrase-resolvase